MNLCNTTALKKTVLIVSIRFQILHFQRDSYHPHPPRQLLPPISLPSPHLQSSVKQNWQNTDHFKLQQYPSNWLVISTPNPVLPPPYNQVLESSSFSFGQQYFRFVLRKQLLLTFCCCTKIQENIHHFCIPFSQHAWHMLICSMALVSMLKITFKVH